MEVRPTTLQDIDDIEFNKYVTHSRELLKAALNFQHMYTFIDNGTIQLIAGYFEFYPHCFKAGIVASKYLNRFILPEVRIWILEEAYKRNCLRLETEGINDSVLDRFHRFLKFKPEVIINNGGYVKWVFYLEEQAHLLRHTM